jgi:hypothetical protein
MNEQERHGGGPSHSPLYNGHIGDSHFSPKGATLWGKALARRVALLLEFRDVHRHTRNEPSPYQTPEGLDSDRTPKTSDTSAGR